MTIFDRVKALNLPFGEYVVFGSGLLDALGLREANDIDIAASPSLYKTLRATGKWKEEERWGKIFLVRDGVDVSPQLHWEDYLTTTEEAIASALVIEGVSFMNPKELIKFKRAFGREKDLRDIDLLTSYLATTA